MPLSTILHILPPALQLNTNRPYFPWFHTSFMPSRNQAESIVIAGFHHLSTWAAPMHSPTIATYWCTSVRHHYQVPDPPTPSLQYAIDAPSSLLAIHHMSIMPYPKGQFHLLKSPKLYASGVLFPSNVRLNWTKSRLPSGYYTTPSIHDPHGSVPSSYTSIPFTSLYTAFISSYQPIR